jgi:hypothetical protein
LDEARRYRHGRVLLYSGVRGWLVLNTPVRDVTISEPEVEALVRAIDERLALPAVDLGRWPPPEPARAEFRIQKPHASDSRDLTWRRWHNSELVHGMSKEIMDVLRGLRPRLGAASTA